MVEHVIQHDHDDSLAMHMIRGSNLEISTVRAPLLFFYFYLLANRSVLIIVIISDQ